MVCDRDNIGSAKSIVNNGDFLENEIILDGIVEQRYWKSAKNIELDFKKAIT